MRKLRTILAEEGMLTASASLQPWMGDVGLAKEMGKLRLFIARPEYGIWLSPGPMRREGNFEYCLGIKDGKLHLPTDAEIALHRAEMVSTHQGIGEREVVWWEPSGKLYQFGIRVNADSPNQALIRGRPNNARGRSLDLGVSDAGRAVTSLAGIRAYLARFEGKTPKFNR